jgi:hypothetical protein
LFEEPYLVFIIISKLGVLGFKMDDCNLDKLVIKPGKLSPAFHKDTTEYNVTLPSNVAKIHIDPLTSDTGASYCISVSHYKIFNLYPE